MTIYKKDINYKYLLSNLAEDPFYNQLIEYIIYRQNLIKSNWFIII